MVHITVSIAILMLYRSGLEVIKVEFFLKLKIKRNDWVLADTCPQAANYLRNEFNFWKVHGIMNTSGIVHSK